MINKILNLIKNSCALSDEVTQETNFVDLSLDSLSFICIIVNLEEEFNIEFDIEKLDIRKWIKVSDLINSVEVMINEKE